MDNLIDFEIELDDELPRKPESQEDGDSIGALFDQRIKALEALAKKIVDVKNKCKKAEQEVEHAKNCDFKGWFFDNQTKAIEYLQNACVALSNSQCSTQEALDLVFEYQSLSSKMTDVLIMACSNNYNAMNELQNRINTYLNQNNQNDEILEQVLPAMNSLKTKVVQDMKRLEEINSLKGQLEAQQVLVESINHKNSTTNKYFIGCVLVFSLFLLLIYFNK